MKTKRNHLPVLVIIVLYVSFFLSYADDPLFITIPGNVETEFGKYQPLNASFNPMVSDFDMEVDFSDVDIYQNYKWRFNAHDSALFQQNYFTVKKGFYKQMFDVYNNCTWDGTPLFISTDAVLHIYHILFDQILQDIESDKFSDCIKNMTSLLSAETELQYNSAKTEPAREALHRNLAFLSVGRTLIHTADVPVPESVKALVDSELVLINKRDGFYFSPVFGPFNKLDYSQFKPRGHYTKSDTLKAYFLACMWYGKMIFTMEPEKFGELAYRHTLQALALVQAVYNTAALADWERVYETTSFFVGRSDDPGIIAYKRIAESIYGQNFLALTVDSLSNTSLLEAFMEEAKKLPEPKIPNWIYGSFTTYKGFRFMGQRYIPDSYMFSRLVLPYVSERLFPKGLDIMAILGSGRAYTIMDSVYGETSYNNYSKQIESFKDEFSQKPAEDWAQNLYWNWLYTLMPLLFEKGAGYPPFMKNEAWSDKELMTALASWTELRHDAILYAKQSMSPCCVPPGPPRSYVEPNPYLYARLASLSQYTQAGLENRNLLSDEYAEKLDLFQSLLLFLLDISIKELEEKTITDSEYENMYCFGKVMKKLVSDMPDPNNPWDYNADDMAIVADVHTDSNTDQCLEEGVGYPLEIFVIVNHGGYKRLTVGTIFSYYEFVQPIADRLTDESWREILAGDNPPDLPGWFSSFMDPKETNPEYMSDSPENLYDKEFTAIGSTKDIKLPEDIYLHQNYPNPFNPSTTIRFHIPNSKFVTIKVYNILGEQVATLVSEQLNPGTHTIHFYGKDLASGVYYYQLVTDNFKQFKKMILLK